MMTGRHAAQCLFCIHWRSPLDQPNLDGVPDPPQTCDAYPGGIPDDIWWNRADHRQPQPGDHGIGWAPLDGAEFPEYAMNT
jgi:hypothetical protein